MGKIIHATSDEGTGKAWKMESEQIKRWNEESEKPEGRSSGGAGRPIQLVYNKHKHQH